MRRTCWATILLVACVAAACGGPDETTATGGQPVATTAVTATTATTAVTATTTPDTTSPEVSPSGPNLWFDGIWPDSRSALDEAKAAFEEGHPPWPADPVATARAYLLDLGLPEPTMGDYETLGSRAGAVHYQAGAASGAVRLHYQDGNPLPYIVRLVSARAEVVRTEREGDALRVEVASLAPGTIVARAGAFGSEWQDEQEAPAPLGPPVRFTLAVKASTLPLLLEVRHEGEDGTIGISRVRVQPNAPSSASGTPAGDRLSAASRLRPDGIGPIDIGMTHDQALVAAGVSLIVAGTEYCGHLRVASGLDFVSMVSTEGSDGRITVVSVSGDSVATVEGIRVGSTEADVMTAYPGTTRHGDGDAHRLVHRLPGSKNAGDPVIVFVVVNSKVVGMQAGVGAVVEAEEYCS